MAAKKKAKKKGHKKGYHKKAAHHSTAKKGAKRHSLKAGMTVKTKPSRSALAKAKLRVVGFTLGRRKKGKKGKK